MKLGFGKAFALPTVLIVSVVMMMVLAVSVSATAASRQTLLTQYYDQLAQTAGDAGTAYAKACLNDNNNIPSWTSSSPLTPNTDCTGTPVVGYPTYVTNYNDIRSSFSVGAPTVDADGRATTIPNSGYVQLLRHSTQTVWKTYTQPNFQSAVVPDLCTAGNTPSSAGWGNSVITTTTATNNIAGSQVISVSNSAAINPGYMFFRKDFSVNLAQTYTEQLRADDGAEVYVDGKLHWSSMSGYNSIVSNSINLTVGCHSIVIKLINGGVTPSTANFSYALTPQGSSTPKVVSDTSWRFATGDTVPFSDSRYYLSSSWLNAAQISTTSATATWAAQASWPDLTAGWVGSSSGTIGSYPGSQYTYLIDNNANSWKFSSPTTVKMYVQCDDSCRIFMDNNATPIMTSNGWSTVTSQTFTLPEGQHRVSVELYNGATSPNASGFMMTAINTTTNRVIDNTSDGQWKSNNAWSSTQSIPYSYDPTYLPSPDTLVPRYTLNLLLVGGGGAGGGNGGGGGGAGGVVGSSNYNVYVGTTLPINYPVTVGAGGAVNGGAVGGNGGNSIFGNSTLGQLTAYGGGGGSTRGSTAGASGGSSGGGGGGQASPGNLSSVAIQGNIGANGPTPDPGCSSSGGGGGGAGSVGTNGVSGLAGNGGYGLTTKIGSYSLSYAGGGAGGIVCAASGSNGTPVAGYGGGAAGVAATPNTGGGGGGGSGSVSQTAGGSGVVVVWFVTGTITASAVTSGGVTINPTTSGGYTIFTFTTSGTFTITALN